MRFQILLILAFGGGAVGGESASTTDRYTASLTRTFHRRSMHHESRDPTWGTEPPPSSSFLEVSSTTQDSSGLEAQLTVQFCKSNVHRELRQSISSDIAEMESSEAQTQAISVCVGAFNDAFIQPFLDLFVRLFVDPLKMAFGDVCPWYLTGPISGVLNGMAPKPIVMATDALLANFMPPLMVISMTKKLVKSLTLILTASTVSTVERARSGTGASNTVGDMGGTQQVIMAEVTRKIGVDMSNHLMDSVPMATERALSHTLASSLSTSVQLYYYCTYCYWFGDYCKQCFYLPDYTWKEGKWWQKQRATHLSDRGTANRLEKQAAIVAMADDKPVSPITAAPGTSDEYTQQMNNQLAADHRKKRMSKKGRELYAQYAKDQGLDAPEPDETAAVVESTVETEDPELSEV